MRAQLNTEEMRQSIINDMVDPEKSEIDMVVDTIPIGIGFRPVYGTADEVVYHRITGLLDRPLNDVVIHTPQVQGNIACTWPTGVSGIGVTTGPMTELITDLYLADQVKLELITNPATDAMRPRAEKLLHAIVNENLARYLTE